MTDEYTPAEDQSDYSRLLEMREDERRMNEEERRRFEEEHPSYHQCPKHPDRPVVDSGVCTKRHCAECIEEMQARALDDAIHRGAAGMNDPRNWRAEHDMRYYSDHPNHSYSEREDKK